MGRHDAPAAGEDLLRLLGSDDLAWLLRVVAARAADGTELVGPVSLLTATPSQRAAAAALFGLRPALRGATVRLEELDFLLRTSGTWPGGLADAATALADGVLVLPPTPLVQSPAPALRPTSEETWARLAHLPTAPVDWLSWWREERSRGVPEQILADAGSAEAAAEVATHLADVLELLPAAGELRADLAEAVTGSPTDLDGGPLATLVLRALRWRRGRAFDDADDADDADEHAWASAGVVCDELTDTVLTLDLPVEASGASGAALVAWAAVGQPVVLTFRQLRLDPLLWRPAPSDGEVQVCAGPRDLGALVAARAAAGGGQRVPAVCVGELPSVSTQFVLAGLRGAGWRLRERLALPPDRSRRLVRGRAAQPRR